MDEPIFRRRDRQQTTIGGRRIAFRRPTLDEACTIEELSVRVRNRDDSDLQWDREALAELLRVCWGMVKGVGDGPAWPVDEAAEFFVLPKYVLQLAEAAHGAGELGDDEQGESDGPSRSSSAAPSTDAETAQTVVDMSGGADTASRVTAH